MSRTGVALRRGGVPESRHQVSAALVDAAGRLIAWVGDPELLVFLRSAAKPFQALPLLADGPAVEFGMTAPEIALCCASHNGEPAQVRVISRFLRRVGGRVSDLACGPHPPLHAPTARALAARGRRPSRLHNNCSGKHAGMIAWTRHAGLSPADYHKLDHPVQARVRQELADWAEVDPARMPVAIDGCGVPTFALPLDRMARAFARLSRAAASDPRSSAGRVVNAMRTQPYYVGGKGRLCTQLMQHADRPIVAKIGAEGIFGVGLLDSGEGLALKIEDGARRAVGPAVLEFLGQTGRLGAESLETLDRYRGTPVKNTRGETVGELRAEFDVRFA